MHHICLISDAMCYMSHVRCELFGVICQHCSCGLLVPVQLEVELLDVPPELSETQLEAGKLGPGRA